MSLEGSVSMREIDGLSIIFIDLYVQRSHHNSIDLKPRCSSLIT